MAITGGIRGIKSGSETRALVKETLGEAASKDRSKLKKVFAQAAGADGNKHLSLTEAQLVRDAFDTATDTGTLDVKALSKTVAEQVTDALKTRDPDGIKTYFTSTTKNMSTLR